MTNMADEERPSGERSDRRGKPPPFKPLDLFADLTAALRAELQLANHLPHWGEVGSAIEVGLRAFLNRTLPDRFEAASGFAFGTNGAPSDQCDVLIIDRHACTKLLRFQDAGLFPIDGVMARVEIKRTLNQTKWKEDLDSVLMFRAIPTHLRAGKNQCAPFAYLFGAEAGASAETVAGWYADAWVGRPEHRAFMPNAVVVPGEYVVYPVAEMKVGWAPWADTIDAEGVAFIRPTAGIDITLGFWLDLLLAHLQVLSDRRHEAYARSCEVPNPPTVASSFIPTLLHYFSPELEMSKPISFKR
jgi:hypothetical protein